MELPDENQKTPEEYVLMNELKESLVKAIDTLKEKERKIISLYYFDELTFKEIGMVLGISESRVSQLHTRALMKIKRQIEIH
jgi:RNA polymerase sigma factor for flagellar operon FliA